VNETVNLAALGAKWRAEYPYLLNYTRRGGPKTALGLVVGSRIARSREDAERIQRGMELTDSQYGHVTTYSIELRAGTAETRGA
jgi:hypothetical protein